MYVPSVLDEGPDYHDKDDNVKKQDGKDGTKESTKEYCRIKDKTAGEGKMRPNVSTYVVCYYRYQCHVLYVTFNS